MDFCGRHIKNIFVFADVRNFLKRFNTVKTEVCIRVNITPVWYLNTYTYFTSCFLNLLLQNHYFTVKKKMYFNEINNSKKFLRVRVVIFWSLKTYLAPIQLLYYFFIHIIVIVFPAIIIWIVKNIRQTYIVRHVSL